MTDKIKISIFGSTGSIGVNTVDVVHRAGAINRFDVKVLSGGENVKLLAQQAQKTCNLKWGLTSCYQGAGMFDTLIRVEIKFIELNA